MTDDAASLLDRLGLTEYESTALRELLTLGRTTAPNLAQATGIPKARIYGVLDSLSDRGFIKIIPGRPKEYQPKSPAEILDRAEENRRQEFEGFVQELDDVREEFLAEFRPRFERASEDITPTEELFHVVDVGEPSERETRQLYHQADEQVRIITKSFEYFDSVRPAFEEAIDRGIDVDAIFLHPDLLEAENRPIQADIVERIRTEYPAVDLRFSEEPLPWRGTVADPSMDYETGRAIILVEEKDVPLHMRQAALTDNGSFVAGLQRYFDLVWEHESQPPSALDE
ncbi:TrmB family transcriptional regulator [Halorientalis sp. IM1011]|uniref:TrmB family transcriptional regulator n=1 Tax=Halorientalis sp. IM1011 TaxID=1932360 RepID=UPI00097CC941|nr:helix-turn-helix domain-containing protein [Halorientalis sp. IM1011]AQL41258.1 TrmB family transcriptional regulator [Halorientalis sp. IM1011]